MKKCAQTGGNPTEVEVRDIRWPGAITKPLVVFSVAVFGCCASLFADLNFVQLTDPHLFDKIPDQDNQRAVSWCVSKINEAQDRGANYRFVVMTGDVGLEGVADFLHPEKQHAEIMRAAQELAASIRPSKVKKWLFLPGNNDLVEEDPRTIEIYREFIETLKRDLPELEIADLVVSPLDLTDGDTAYRFIGFDNSSFKSNDSSVDAEFFDSIRQTELRRVADLVATAKGYAYIFYHVPEIDDPFYASLAPDDPKRKARANTRGQFGKDFPLSAWTVAPDIRRQWNAIVADEKVKALFAGHFHSFKREVYKDVSLLNSAPYPAVEMRKLIVCPPIANKNQQDKVPQARGFRSIALRANGSVTPADPTWLDEPSPSPTPTPAQKKCPKDRGHNSGSDRRHPNELLRDIESFLKSLALLLGTVAGFWAWLRYVWQRLRLPRAKLEHEIEPWMENGNEAAKGTLHVILRVHNIGDIVMRGEGETAIELMGHEFPTDRKRSQCDVIAPGEAKEFHFDFPIERTSKTALRVAVTSSFEARFWLLLPRRDSRRTWSIRTFRAI
jgi:hypothetical protein